MNTPSRWHVHFTSGEKIKWALDEDLRMAQESLGENVVSCSLPAARIVHGAWWPHVMSYGPAALQDKRIICFADNPPAFYLTQPAFVSAARRVDLWIARTREALAQFQILGLPAIGAPYCVDQSIFRPTKPDDALRESLNIAAGAFVIGNFHRDSEGDNLSKPKRQKGPDVLLEIARQLHRKLPDLVVLLAGPRRHYLKAELDKEGIPFRLFSNVPVGEGDDYEANILTRGRLNELYQFLDVCVVSSRWEGGPHSLLEALFAGRPVISTPVGIARDILPEECLFRTPVEAAEKLAAHARGGTLHAPTTLARDKALAENNSAILRERLLAAYQGLPSGGISLSSTLHATTALAFRALHGSPGEFPPHPRAALTEKLMNDLQTRPGDPHQLVETPFDPEAPSATEDLLTAAAMCRSANQ